MSTTSTTVLRRGLLALAGIGLLGTTIELVFLRHWSSATATVVWVGIAALGIGYVTLLRRPSPLALRVVQVAASVAFAIAIIGIWFHVSENLTAGPLDRAYAATWDTMAPVAQWWTAITGGVGPAPTLAPGALAEISLALFLATIGWRPEPAPMSPA